MKWLLSLWAAALALHFALPAFGQEVTPATSPDLVLWTRAEDLKAAYHDGDRVFLWPDASGHKNDLKSDGAARPFFKSTEEDAFPSVTFAGNLKATPVVNQSFALPLGGEWRGVTFFFVGRHLDCAGLLTTCQGGAGDLRTLGFAQVTGTEAGLARTFPDIGGSSKLAVATIAAGVDDAGTMTLSTYVNGKAQATSQSKNSMYGVIFRNASIGSGGYFSGEISEFLAYRGQLTSTQRQAVEGYLLAKYSLDTANPSPRKFPVGCVPPVSPTELPPLPPAKSSPAQQGLLLWASADDLERQPEGSLLASWPNKAGNNQPLTAAEANRPSYRPRAINGRPAVHFSGDAHATPRIAQYLSLPLTGSFPEMSIVMAGTHLNAGGTFDSAAGAGNCLRDIGGWQVTGGNLFSGDAFPLFRYQPGPQFYTVQVGKTADGGQYIETYANGHAQARGQTAEKIVPVNFGRAAIGAVNYSEIPFAGDIAEGLIYNHALTAAERKQNDAYLSEKYAIPIKSVAQLALEKSAPTPFTLTTPYIPAAMSWMGNSFSGKSQWVQSGISGINCLPDGTLIATSIWDEPHKEIGFYRDGKPVGPVTSGGASKIVYDDKYFYVGNSGMGKNTAGVRRYLRGENLIGALAPWPDLGEAKWIGFDTGAPWKEVSGLAVTDKELFVIVQGMKEVRVYDKNTAAYLRSIVVDEAGAIAVDQTGNLWLGSGAGVKQFGPDGQATGKAIANVVAGAIAFDAGGQLLVGANGDRQQVVRYDVSGAQPREVGTLGERGGVYAGPRPGAVGTSRLFEIGGVASDAAGNIYVACNGQLTRSYTAAGKFNWQIESSVFCTCSDFDPATDGDDIYSGHNHYKFVGGPNGARQWQWAGVTTDPHRFPELAAGPGPGSILRRLNNGALYRFSNADALTIHRQEKDSETFVPCGYYTVESRVVAYRPKAAPERGRYFWSDTNGNGLAEADEIQMAPEKSLPSRESFSRYIDENGGIWEPEDRYGVRYIPLKGFAPGGAPIYDMSAEVWYPKPAEFIQVLRAVYFAATDRMYLCGNTWDHGSTGKEGGWGLCGHELICYDNWTKPNRKIRSRMPEPKGTRDIKAIAIADGADRAYLGEMEGNVLFNFDTKTGRYLGIIEPDPEVYGGVGWIDIDLGVRAFQRKSGEMLLLAEDSWAQKEMVYRVAPNAAPLPPKTAKD